MFLASFNCHNPEDIKFMTRCRLGLFGLIWAHLRRHKSKHSFQDSINSFKIYWFHNEELKNHGTLSAGCYGKVIFNC